MPSVWLSLLITAAAAFCWGTAARAERDADCRLHWRDGERISVIAEPRDLAPPPGSARSTRRFQLRSPTQCRGPIQVQLAEPDSGDRVLALTGTWRRDPWFEESRWPRRPERAGRLIVLTARPLTVPLGARSRLRVAAERRLQGLFGERRWPLAAALTVSPESAIPAELRERFTRSGLAHILSISGLHVGLLAAALIAVLRACRVSPSGARIAATLLAGGYVWLLGFPAPALRSFGLLALWCWARERQRPPRPGAILAVTALLVLAADPYLILEAGPWLSFAGVWGCAAAGQWWERVAEGAADRRSRRKIRLLSPVVVSAGAVLATTPIQLLVFGTFTPVAVLANLAAIPVAAFATPALALTLVLASLPGGSALAALAASATGFSLDLLELVAAMAASPSWASIEIATPGAAAVGSAAAAFWLLRGGPRRRPAHHIMTFRVTAALLALALVTTCPFSFRVSSPDGGGRLALHFLRVGQGDATAIRTPGGRWLLIDGGPRIRGLDVGARRVVPFLRRRGVRSLDLVVASHGDADHLGGLPAVLSAFPAGLVIEPGTPLGRPLYMEWLAGIARRRARWHAARSGERFSVDGVTIRVWHPDSATIAAGWEPNENSVLLTVEYGAFRAVFGGDAGLPMEALRAASIGDVSVLKVGHHGSRTASGEEWIHALRPELCVIPVGQNRYGHPHPGVVARLRDAGCAVWRTDREGDVTVSTDGGRVDVSGTGRDTTFFVSKEQP